MGKLTSSYYKTKEGRPLCRYCLKLLTENKRHVGREHASTAGGEDWRDICEPAGTYGRNGDDLFCTMTCAEQWATRKLTGRSVPRGKSHGKRGVSDESA